MIRSNGLALCGLLASLAFLVPCSGATWEPLKSDVWIMQDAPLKGTQDAVVLEKRTIFSNNLIETVLRVRVLSEAGRRAVELPRFSADCHHISGRTSYPDGRSVEYDQVQDFKPVVSSKRSEDEPSRVIPKGVTANCVVEVRWQESTWKKYSAALPRRMGSFAEWELGGPFVTLKESLEVVEGFKWRTFLNPGQFQKPAITQEGAYRVIRFQNLPAFKTPPFCLAPLVDRPRFQVFDLPRVYFERAAQSIDEFWKAVMIVPIPKIITRDRIGKGSDRTMNTSRIFQDLDPSVKDSFVDFVRKGSAYRDFAKTVLVDLPTSPQARGQQLLTKLFERMSSGRDRAFEPEEREDMDEIDRIRTGPENLEDAVKARRTTEKGMLILCFQLLREAGLKPKLALLVNRQERFFNYQAPIAWQFTDGLLGLEEPGKATLWLDPVRRHLALGEIHPDLQGGEGLLVDTDTWQPQRFQMALQNERLNRRRFDYQLVRGEHGDQFGAKAHFQGAPAREALQRFGRSDALKVALEAKAGLSLHRAEAKTEHSVGAGLSWDLEGQVKSGNELVPFPGMPSALDSGVLPESRSLPIVMPYTVLHEATATLKVPTGFRVRETPEFRQENRLGSVTWSLTAQRVGEQEQIIVKYAVRINAVTAPHQAYGELQALHAWVRSAESLTVKFDKQ